MILNRLSLSILLLLGCYIISVSAKVLLTCKPGEGVAYGKIFTSGLASQVCGLSKITTEAECKAAAEHNSKNNIDKNVGYAGRRSWSSVPPGCYYDIGYINKYYWNDNTNSTIQCSNGNKCMCKTKTCTECPINTYSEGGINPTCTPCPKDRPTTNFNTGQTSINACIPVPTIKCELGHEEVNDGITKQKLCLPCNYGFYNDKAGTNTMCEKCPSDRPATYENNISTSINACKTDTCQPGYGFDLFRKYTGRCNLPIITAKVCKFAVNYSRKHMSGNNNGYNVTLAHNLHTPFGCRWRGDYDKYEVNTNYKSRVLCTHRNRCFCKSDACKKCPPNTFSEGGIFPYCQSCPDNGILTISSKQDSSDLCMSVMCNPGEGIQEDQHDIIPLRTNGKCKFPITTIEECKNAAAFNKKYDIDKVYDKNIKNAGFHIPPKQIVSGGNVAFLLYDNVLPRGCSKNVDGQYIFNPNKNAKAQCGYLGHKCVCKPKQCSKCVPNTYSNGGLNARCEKCEAPKFTNTDRTKCINSADLFSEMQKQLDKQKEDTNDLSIKNSRLWQTEKVRTRHDEIMKNRQSKDNKLEKKTCKTERKKRSIIFPAIEVSNEIEDKEDTTCIDTNRDELLKSFCSFRMDLDNLFQIQNIDKEAKQFWPNICCKERRDKTLEACEDPNGEINRTNIIPFALSQGGDYSRHNLYVEVTDTIKNNGYLHNGMLNLLDTLPHVNNEKKRNANQLVNSFFQGISLCGPRIIDAPNANDDVKLCELFFSYHHSMKTFYKLIENLYVTPMPPQASSLFLETMEQSLLNRQVSFKTNRLGKDGTNSLSLNPNIGLAKVMTSKSKNANMNETTKCKGGSKPTNFNNMKKTFCKGSNSIDLSNANIKNIAIYYLKDEISSHYNYSMISVKNKIRYDVVDTSCPSKLFDAKDISIQQVAMDTFGKDKEWVAVIQLNTEDKNGYLQSELPYCHAKQYLIGAHVKVKTYIDDTNCCNDYRDVNMCKTYDGCEKQLLKMKDMNDRHFSRDVTLTGSDYVIEDTHHYKRRRRRRRRRLFKSTRSASGSCANRL